MVGNGHMPWIKAVNHNSMPCAYTLLHRPCSQTFHQVSAQWFLYYNLIESAMCLWHIKHEENAICMSKLLKCKQMH